MRTIISIEVDGKQVILNGLSQKDSVALASYLNEYRTDFSVLEAQLAEAQKREARMREKLAENRRYEGRLRDIIYEGAEEGDRTREALEDISWCVKQEDWPYSFLLSNVRKTVDKALSGDPAPGDPAPDPRDAVVVAIKRILIGPTPPKHWKVCWLRGPLACVCGITDLYKALEALE